MESLDGYGMLDGDGAFFEPFWGIWSGVLYLLACDRFQLSKKNKIFKKEQKSLSGRLTTASSCSELSTRLNEQKSMLGFIQRMSEVVALSLLW